MNHFCLMCGSQIVWRELEGRSREICPSCGWVFYQQLKVGAGVLIEQDGRLLLTRRSSEPFLNAWNLPAGYVESDESPVDAAQRETLEETGLFVRITRLVDVYFFDDDPRGDGILIVYEGMIEGGELQVSSESCQAGFFGYYDIPETLAGAGQDLAIRAWKSRYE
jgi:8-oxo-dGTP diphosphatase